MKVKDILVVTVDTVQVPVNMNDYNNPYFCVTLLYQTHEAAGKCYTPGKTVNMNSVVLTRLV